MTIALLKEEATVAVEWTITIQGKNEFGDLFMRFGTAVALAALSVSIAAQAVNEAI